MLDCRGIWGIDDILLSQEVLDLRLGILIQNGTHGLYFVSQFGVHVQPAA